MGTSKYTQSTILPHKHGTVTDGKTLSHQHPITYVSGLFQGSEFNWSALTKEAYKIHITVIIYSINYLSIW